MKFTDSQIAEVVHEAICGLQDVLGDPCPAPHWQVISPEMRESCLEGVRLARKGATPRDMHQSWMDHKLSLGWVYGPVKDDVNKTHPCLIPYEELPKEQRFKDRLFLTIVALMVTS